MQRRTWHVPGILAAGANTEHQLQFTTGHNVHKFGTDMGCTNSSIWETVSNWLHVVVGRKLTNHVDIDATPCTGVEVIAVGKGT